MLEPFTTDDQGEARLVVEKGDHGVAWGTGDDGDLVTVFTRDQETMHWVRAPNFVKLKFRKAEAPPRRQAAAGHLRRPVAVSQRQQRAAEGLTEDRLLREAGVGGRRLGGLEDVAGRA